MNVPQIQVSALRTTRQVWPIERWVRVALLRVACLRLCIVVAVFFINTRGAALDIELTFSGGFERRHAAVAATNQATVAWEMGCANGVGPRNS